MELSKIFVTIQKLAKKEKSPVYTVGGFVRDLILGIGQKQDIDFVVVGSGLEFAKKLDEKLKQIGSLVEFPDFDTARYIIQDTRYKIQDTSSTIELEFAGARAEKYDTDSRKPKVVSATLETDLSRRDFTVNAMAIPIEKFKDLKDLKIEKLSEEIIDPYNGQGDLKKKLLRTPLDPDITFSDDPLRMLRAARFAAQLGFAIEANTYAAMERNVARLKIISAERIQEELFKLLAAPAPGIGLQILYDTGLLQKFLPEVADLHGSEEIFGHQHKNVLQHTFKVVDNLAGYTDNVVLRLAGLLHDIGKPQTKKFVAGRGWTFDMHEHLGKKMVSVIGRRLRLSVPQIKYLAKLVRWHQQPIALMDEGITDSAVRRLIVNLDDNLEDLLKLCRSDITTGNPNKKERRLKNYDRLEKRIAEVIEKDKLRAFQSPYRGEEIMQECGLKPGPTVGKIKKALEEAILDGVIPNEYEATKKYFLEIKDEYLKNAEEWEKNSL
jgi:putative nucleotidyltransferase with HDIG domain